MSGRSERHLALIGAAGTPSLMTPSKSAAVRSCRRRDAPRQLRESYARSAT